MLIIYRELSILELSKRIGKAKSTIYEHLKKMINSGFVKESREEKARSNIYKKFYTWVEKDTAEKEIRELVKECVSKDSQNFNPAVDGAVTGIKQNLKDRGLL